MSSRKEAEIRVGNALPLEKIPLGSFVHNVEMKVGKGGQIARSAGAACQLMAIDGKYALLKTAIGRSAQDSGSVSGHDRSGRAISDHEKVSSRQGGTHALAGSSSSHPRRGQESGGSSRWAAVKGEASGGRHPCTPWGKTTKGYKTRNPRKQSSTNLIVRRRNVQTRG